GTRCLARRKYVNMLPAVRTKKSAHILHQPQHGHVSIFEHRHRLSSIYACYILWRRNQDSPVQLQFAAESGLWFTCAGRKVDDQIIQLAPVNTMEQLPDEQSKHIRDGSNSLFFTNEEPYRHYFDAVTRQWFKHLVALKPVPLAQG